MGLESHHKKSIRIAFVDFEKLLQYCPKQLQEVSKRKYYFYVWYTFY